MSEREHLGFSVIDAAKWDQAQWRGVLYLVDVSFKQAPVFGLIFRYEKPAVDIFTDWRSRVGREDEDDQIRIAIVEGEIAGQDYGYTVHITIDPEYATEKLRQQGNELQPGSFFGVSRVFRMNPDPSSKNLPNFKRALSQVGKYSIIPVIASSANMTASTVKPRMDLGISKKTMVFRNAQDIKKGDIDSVVFAKGL